MDKSMSLSKRPNALKSIASQPVDFANRIIIYILFIFLTIISLYPFVWLFLNSLKSETEMFEQSWSLPTVYHWDHYARAWEFGISRYLVNSFLVTVLTVLLTVTLSTMAAYALARFKFPGQTVLLFFILGGLMLAPEVSLIPLFRILVRMGIYNTYFALILPYTAFGIPFTTFLIRAYILGLPKELEEAARIDGAGAFAVFRHVIVPLSRPIIASAALLQAMHSWNEFMFALTFLESDKLRTLPIGIMSFVSTLRTEWTVVMAGLVISAIPMILLFLLTQRQFVRGLTRGGIKG